MKEYVDEKFWRMLSGFITLIITSVVLLLVIKVYKDKEVSSVKHEVKNITSNQ